MKSPTVTVADPAAQASRLTSCLDVVQNLLSYAAKCPLPVPDKADGRIVSPGVVRVPLVGSDGRFALVDAEDYPLVQRYRWHTNSGGYAIASSGGQNVLMHRLILMVGPNTVVDHRNHDTADNRKANLRACSHAENVRNARLSVNSTTRVKGVARSRYGWQAYVTKDGVRYTRNHKTFEAACEWVRAKRIELHGEFACHL
jgi:hypothetical protein